MKKLKFFCPHWGSKHLPFQDFAAKAKADGYDGLEMGMPLDAEQRKHYLDVLKDYELELLGQQWEANESDFNKYKTRYEKQLVNLIEAEPVLINSQTGKDYFSRDQNLFLLNLAENLSREGQIPIVHETHRGKFSFACHILAQFLEWQPEFRLCLDVSHWFNVAESDLTDQEQNLQRALSRTSHIHARVGHTQSAQVSDPRLPEWKFFLDRHLAIWDQVVAHWKSEEKSVYTFTPEFGPEPYMNLTPFTRQPVTSQWEVNLYMKNLLQQRYKDHSD